MNRHALWLLLAIGSVGCVVVDGDGDGADPGGTGGTSGTGGTASEPIGPVASNAVEAWPTKPDVAPISAEQIATACALQTACAKQVDPETDALLAVELCTGQIAWSAERAIPLSGLWSQQERAELMVSCVIASAGDCAAVSACATSRDKAISCQEDGCRIAPGQGTFDVTCDGDIATLENAARKFTRDCARAFATCDPASPTGCTDRQFSRCPDGVSKADRCDGNVRLGCDGAGQVSYRDCERMGGVCGTTSDGAEGCIYREPADPGCESDRTVPSAACDGETLSICINGERVSVAAPGVCPAG